YDTRGGAWLPVSVPPVRAPRRVRPRQEPPLRARSVASRRARPRGRRRPRPGRSSRDHRHEGRMSQTELERAVGEILIDEETLGARISELGAEISADYQGRDLLLIGVLKGAVFFMADLMRHLTVQCEV